MDVKLSQFVSNKTYRFLAPCLAGNGQVFRNKINQLRTLAFALHDTLLDGSPPSKDRNIYVLVDKLYKRDFYESFFSWFKYQPYYNGDYCPISNAKRSRLHMIVVKVPEEYYNAYDMFLLGKYSKMYTEQQISNLFTEDKRNLEIQILTKSEFAKKAFINKLNNYFNLKLTENSFDNELEEYELPIFKDEEIFNCNNEQEAIFVEQIDKIWKN